MAEKKFVVLIDDTCTLCNRSVAFMNHYGGGDEFDFISLYADEGKSYLDKYGLPENYTVSVVLIDRERNRAYLKSGAVLRIARKLKGLWPALYILLIVPRFIRDTVYDIVAKHRHGPTGTVQLFFRKQLAQFVDADVHHRSLEF